ncbi:MAG: uracil-DNA glycosylase family protein [candidate division WOR-3 bacterium]
MSLIILLSFIEKNSLNKNLFRLVFISRDPNLKVEKEVSSTNQAIINLKTPPPKKGLGWFFNDFLTINCLWSRFLEFLKNPNNESRFYWTHLVKCYAKNSQEEVQKAKNFCKNYLSEELKQLDPKLIIGAGLDVARVLVEIGYLQANKDNLRFKNLQPINEKTLEGRERIIIIPHPSQSPYQTWKNGCFKIGITHKELTELIKKWYLTIQIVPRQFLEKLFSNNFLLAN